MSPSSSEFGSVAVACQCGTTFKHFGSEWPPVFTICPNCRIHLTLDAHDPKTGRTSFREIP